ncbi:hypothetical protein [Halosimplex marinum]|uniref:hypothetical protein n=1 Tax=Halosimplex marinum TaxID=3396620 RepID=UPI003F57E981
MSAALDLEAGPVAVGALVGLAGVTFLLEPLVGPLPVGGLRVRPVALSAVVLAAALLLGAVVFYRRGRRLFALAHGVFGLAWASVVLGTATGNGVLLVGGVVLVIAGCGFLVGQARER